MFARITTLVAATALFATVAVALPGDFSSSENKNIVNAPNVNACNYAGGMQCCNSFDHASQDDMQTLLNVIDIPVDANTIVGHGCSPLLGVDATCNAQTACCKGSYQGIGVSCDNIAA